jgi:hypothetical protein
MSHNLAAYPALLAQGDVDADPSEKAAGCGWGPDLLAAWAIFAQLHQSRSQPCPARRPPRRIGQSSVSASRLDCRATEEAKEADVRQIYIRSNDNFTLDLTHSGLHSNSNGEGLNA